MSWFSDARALVYLRRLVVMQERSVLALEQIAQVMRDDWDERHTPQLAAKPVTIGTFDVEEANKRYEQEREMMARGTRIQP